MMDDNIVEALRHTVPLCEVSDQDIEAADLIFAVDGVSPMPRIVYGIDGMIVSLYRNMNWGVNILTVSVAHNTDEIDQLVERVTEVHGKSDLGVTIIERANQLGQLPDSKTITLQSIADAFWAVVPKEDRWVLIQRNKTEPVRFGILNDDESIKLAWGVHKTRLRLDCWDGSDVEAAFVYKFMVEAIEKVLDIAIDKAEAEAA